MGNYGLKATKDGYGITTADKRNLAFSSAFNTFKIVLQGTMTVEPADDASTATGEFSHNLNYKPGFMVCCRTVDGANIDSYPNWMDINAHTFAGTPKFTSWVSTTKLYIKCWGIASLTYYARYYILADPSK